MTHKEQYDAIIKHRRENPLSKDEYGEVHHIIPKSICPLLDKDKDNLVRLSAREHFLAHYHLWLFYRDEQSNNDYAKKMLYALHRMKQELRLCDDLDEMSRLYEEARVAMSDSQRGEKNHMFGKHHVCTDETKRKISESKIGAKNPMYNKDFSEEHRRKISKSLRGHMGYWTGKRRPKSAIDKTRAKLIGKRWFTNGIKNVKSSVCPEGFTPGRTTIKTKSA